MKGEAMSDLSPARWAYLKQLRPSRGTYLHVSNRWVRHPLAAIAEAKHKAYFGPQHVLTLGETYNVGRNKAKRDRREAERIKRTRVSCVMERIARDYDKELAADYYNGREPAPSIDSLRALRAFRARQPFSPTEGQICQRGQCN